MTKSMLLPIISILAFAIKSLFHIELSQDLQSQIAQWILGGILLGTNVWGIVKNHKKEGK